MPDIQSQLSTLIQATAPSRVWTAADFAQLGNRAAVDKALQRMVRAGEIRRIDRGLYDRPSISKLTKRTTAPDYRAVVDAIARRDQLRMLVDGMTAANDLGLTDAVPAHVTIHTDARRRSIKLVNLQIEFKLTAPSRLYWAGRPAMRVVQALHWLKDTLPSDEGRVIARLNKVLSDPVHGTDIRRDLVDGFRALPTWMQDFVRALSSFDTRVANVESEQIHRPAARQAVARLRPSKRARNAH